jgi:hypothetical protein
MTSYPNSLRRRETLPFPENKSKAHFFGCGTEDFLFTEVMDVPGWHGTGGPVVEMVGSPLGPGTGVVVFLRQGAGAGSSAVLAPIGPPPLPGQPEDLYTFFGVHTEVRYGRAILQKEWAYPSARKLRYPSYKIQNRPQGPWPLCASPCKSIRA